ncbi:MAG: MBL fold metallo-hydrolase [Methanotrichaceae archaeon]|nr:MBL fold metallo-hydrolase [Methanotrichaceae archaeon]
MHITGNIHALKHVFYIEVAPDVRLERFVYSYIVFDSEICLIDSGVKGCEESIFKYIRNQGHFEEDIRYLILSHSHPDHIGSASKIKEKTNCTVVSHRGDQKWIEDLDQQFSDRPVPDFFALVADPVKVDKLVSDGESVLFDECSSVSFLFTPGHSPGSLSLYFPNEKALFTGDAIPVKGDIPNYDSFRLMQSSLEKLEKLTGIEWLLSSWSDPLSDKSSMHRHFNDGKEYLLALDTVVKKYYLNTTEATLETCKLVIDELKLPPVYVNQLSHKAFMSHISD